MEQTKNEKPKPEKVVSLDEKENGRELHQQKICLSLSRLKRCGNFHILEKRQLSVPNLCVNSFFTYSKPLRDV